MKNRYVTIINNDINNQGGFKRTVKLPADVKRITGVQALIDSETVPVLQTGLLSLSHETGGDADKVFIANMPITTFGREHYLKGLYKINEIFPVNSSVNIVYQNTSYSPIVKSYKLKICLFYEKEL